MLAMWPLQAGKGRVKTRAKNTFFSTCSIIYFLKNKTKPTQHPWLPPILSSQENKRCAGCFHNECSEQDFPFTHQLTCPANNQVAPRLLPVYAPCSMQCGQEEGRALCTVGP